MSDPLFKAHINTLILDSAFSDESVPSRIFAANELADWLGEKTPEEIDRGLYMTGDEVKLLVEALDVYASSLTTRGCK